MGFVTLAKTGNRHRPSPKPKAVVAKLPKEKQFRYSREGLQEIYWSVLFDRGGDVRNLFPKD